MKQLLFAFAALLLLLSCNNDTDTTGTNDNNVNSANANRDTENMRMVYNAMETGDVSKLDSILAEDVIDHNGAPDGGDIRGRDSVKRMIGEIHTYFDGLNVELLSDARSADGNYHFALVRMTGTAKKNPWGMPEGMKMDDTSVDVVKMRDGMATEHWGFLSWGDINEMMKGMSGGNNQTGHGNKPAGNTTAGGDTSQRR
jgi:ketosteroid isomerase-like protein